MRISVVVPTLDEAARLPRLLAALRWMPLHEVIVVDGGSRDGTVAMARAGGAVVLASAVRGRGPQLAMGAQAATGDVVWFLHADAVPPVDAVALIRRALGDGRVVGGAFLLHTISDGPVRRFGLLLRVADLRSRWTRLPYGDQGLFVRASSLRAIGGVPELPLFEDLELAQRLRAIGRLARIDAEVRVSGRRFERAPLYHALLMNAFPLLRRLGVPEAWMSKWYLDIR